MHRRWKSIEPFPPPRNSFVVGELFERADPAFRRGELLAFLIESGVRVAMGYLK
jgi:hypothetical protein